MKLSILIFTAAPLAAVFGGELLPTADGTSWRYNMTEEIGKGLDVQHAKPDADGKIRLPVLYRINGTENIDGKDLLKFEMHRGGAITNTDLLTINEQGIVCWARINLDGELVNFNPPQMLNTPSAMQTRPANSSVGPRCGRLSLRTAPGRSQGRRFASRSVGRLW